MHINRLQIIGKIISEVSFIKQDKPENNGISFKAKITHYFKQTEDIEKDSFIVTVIVKNPSKDLLQTIKRNNRVYVEGPIKIFYQEFENKQTFVLKIFANVVLILEDIKNNYSLTNN